MNNADYGTDTVLSFHEDPAYETPPRGEDTTKWNAAELKNMRSNVVSVLMQLSNRGYEEYKTNILSLKSVRQPLSKDMMTTNGLRRMPSLLDPEDRERYISYDGSSNLFYYLFEDYTAAVPILKISRKALHDLVSSTCPS
jgi:hypothetical protein